MAKNIVRKKMMISWGVESVAHLLVMLNFSSNFLIYCSVSAQFKEKTSLK
jgi:hypothetical protein